MSNKYEVENETLQRSVISPILLSSIITDIFGNVLLDMGRSLFADDGALWKRRRKLSHIVKKLQEGINQVEMWGKKCGFKFSVETTTVMFFTRKRIRGNTHFKLMEII